MTNEALLDCLRSIAFSPNESGTIPRDFAAALVALLDRLTKAELEARIRAANAANSTHWYGYSWPDADAQKKAGR